MNVYHKKVIVGILIVVLVNFVATPFSFAEEGQSDENTQKESENNGFWYKHWWCPFAKSITDLVVAGSDEPVLIQCVDTQENDAKE